MKKWILCFLLLGLLMLPCFAADATPTDLTGAVVSVRSPLPGEVIFFDTASGSLFYWDDEGSRIDYALPDTVLCELADGTAFGCVIRWDNPASLPIDGTAHSLAGELALPAGCTLAASQPVLTVFSLSTALPKRPITIASFTYPTSGGLMKPGDALPAENEPTAALCYLEGDNIHSFYCPLVWEWSTVKTNTPGIYTIVSQLPAYFAAESLPTYQVSVMDDGFIDLSYCAGRDFSGNPIFRWTWGTDADIADIRLYRKVSKNGAWELMPGEQQEWFPNGTYFSEAGGAFYTTQSLTIARADLQRGTDYFYQMEYRGRYSNVLQLSIAAAGDIRHALGGDRGLADRPEQFIPGFQQPAAMGSDSSLETAALEPVTEQVTESCTVLSGGRLRGLLAANPTTVLFEKHGISLELSSPYLSSLALADQSLLTVCITAPSARTFRMALLIDESAITALPSSLVSMPYTPEPGEDIESLACYDESGLEIGMATYHPAIGIVTFSISAPGTYTVHPRAVPAAQAPADPLEIPSQSPADPTLSLPNGTSSPTLPITIGLAVLGVLLLAGGGVLRRRRPHDQ